jgi:hypothetical protein
MVVCYNCDNKGHYSSGCLALKKNGNEESKMVSKTDFKNLFQSSLKEIISKKQNNDKNNMELDDEYLDMNVFDKLMEGKHNEIVIKNDEGSMSIENTNDLFHFEQTNTPDKSYIKNYYYYYYEEIDYPFSEKIKLKHEPESAPKNKPL